MTHAWLFPEQLNLLGIQALGMSIGTIMHERGIATNNCRGARIIALTVPLLKCLDRWTHGGRMSGSRYWIGSVSRCIFCTV